MTHRKSSKGAQTKAARQEAARAGNCVLSFSAAMRDRVQALASEGLPDGKFALVKELTKALESTAQVLMRSTRVDTVVVVDRLMAERLILSLAVLNAPVNSMIGVDNAETEVRQSEERIAVAAKELIELNASLHSESASFEEFIARTEELSYPAETNQLLYASTVGANIELVGSVARIHMKQCRRHLTRLPSSRSHLLTCTVTGAEDMHVGTFNVVLRLVSVVSPQDSVARNFSVVRSTFVNPELRRFLLRAFLDGSQVQIRVQLPSIPLIRTDDTELEADIVEWE